MPINNLQPLIDLPHTYLNQPITISESISRSRNVGKHDRHFATHTFFSFTVDNIFVAFSGAQLTFMGEEARYGISLDSVVRYHRENGQLDIVEHFEQETERLTTISINNHKPKGDQ